MTDLGVALGLLLVLEGLLWAASPAGMKRAATIALTIDNAWLRTAGLATAALGVLVVWLMRG